MQRFLALLLLLMLAATACTTSTTTTTTAASSDVEADGSESDGPEPTSAPAEPIPTETTELADDADVADVQEEPDATEGTDDDRATAMLEQSDLGNDLSAGEIACVVTGLASQPDLFANAISGTDFDDLDLEDKVDTAIIAMDCAPEAAAAQFTSSFTEDMTQAQPAMGPELGLCLADQLGPDNPARRDVMLGFASLDENLPIPSGAEGAMVDSITTCAPGPVFAEWMIAEFADDPAMANAIDSDCIRTAFPDDTIRGFWTIVVTEGGDMDNVDPEAMGPFLNAMFSCISMGQIMAEQAALDGITISQSTIDCIDTEMAGEDLQAMMSGEDPEGEARITAILFGCLSPEEIAQLGG